MGLTLRGAGWGGVSPDTRLRTAHMVAGKGPQLDAARPAGDTEAAWIRTGTSEERDATSEVAKMPATQYPREKIPKKNRGPMAALEEPSNDVTGRGGAPPTSARRCVVGLATGGGII